MQWKIINSEIELKNDFFLITKEKCQKEDGTIVDPYYTINRPDVAVIGVFTENNELVLIEQYRHPTKSIDIELPAGYLESFDKDIKEGAMRELLEETGYKSDELIKLNQSHASAGLMNNEIYFFIGFNAKKISKQKLDTAETIKLKVTPWKETLKLLEEGKIRDMASVTGILLIKNYLDERNIS